MTVNENGVDRAIRLVLGIALVTLALVMPVARVAQVALGTLGIVALVTATIGFCPLYTLLDISTCRR